MLSYFNCRYYFKLKYVTLLQLSLLLIRALRKRKAILHVQLYVCFFCVCQHPLPLGHTLLIRYRAIYGTMCKIHILPSATSTLADLFVNVSFCPQPLLRARTMAFCGNKLSCLQRKVARDSFG